MKLESVRIYLPGGTQIFFAVGGVLMAGEGKEMIPRITVIGIRFDEFFREVKILLDSGDSLVYHGLNVSYDRKASKAWRLKTELVDFLKSIFGN